ncbi:hypothetical protein CFB46_22665 [Burkholderia sp. HI2761]|uniref:hypothetical protein n=1 Tax=unclassified Burkholderia TaxID=2613784 RepID=UPI000B7A3C1E|nr:MULTISPECIES: hypothetical protein [unclassified Burkholderia]MPV59268.1 hypothetical protein [Burkholderia sp. BE24]OXJ23673.1 hypothetical protein CFB46_22665 [Burkholderia sp. HI2761]
MTNHAMQTASGRVTAISQQSIETKVWSNNLGATTQSIEEITLQLDSLASPLVFRTNRTTRLFIAAGDRLNVAYADGQDHPIVYGIRNMTDGSTYLLRPAKVASARTDLVVMFGCVVAAAVMSGIVSAVTLSTESTFDVFALISASAIGLCVLSAILRILFGVILWPEIRRLAQPGGKREMNAATQALSFTQDETRHVRFI